MKAPILIGISSKKLNPIKISAVEMLDKKNNSFSFEAILNSFGNKNLFASKAIATSATTFKIIGAKKAGWSIWEKFWSKGTNKITKKSCIRRMDIIIRPVKVFVSLESAKSFITIIVEENARIAPTKIAASRDNKPVKLVKSTVTPITPITCRNVPISKGFPVCKSLFTEVSIPIEKRRKAAPRLDNNCISGVIALIPN